jgi:hypothetical protein
MRFDGDLTDEGPAAMTVEGSPGFAPGIDGQAALLTAEDYVHIPMPVGLAVTTLSFELWARNDGGAVLVGRRGLVDYNAHWALFWENAGLSVFQNGNPIDGVMPPSVGQWHHYAVTNDGTVTTLYLDGLPVATAGPGSLRPNPGTEAFAIGANAPDGADNWLGAIDGLRVFSTVRTAEQICEAAGCAAP